MQASAWFHRIKAAQRDLIRLAGGIDRASEISSVSPSHIGRMNNPRDTDLMPISVVYALESECGLPLVTSAMAELSGRRLTDPEGDRALEQSAILAYADMMQQAGDLFPVRPLPSPISLRPRRKPPKWTGMRLRSKLRLVCSARRLPV